MILQTKRLVLREPRQTDLIPMFAVYNDPKAMRYWFTPRHTEIASTQKVLDRRITQWVTAPTNFQITMNDRYIGHAGGSSRNDEIGFILQPNYWRRHIVTEAMGAIIPHLFQLTNHQQLTASTDPNNTACCGVLRSLGFHKTHWADNRLDMNGTWAHTHYFALPRIKLVV